MERNEAEEKMLGFYDYTVVLTYCSVISAVIGIYVSLSGAGHWSNAFVIMWFV